MKMKKRLSAAQEFEIMKLVLDKFLWLGFGIMAAGVWIMRTGNTDQIMSGLTYMVAGAIVLVLFMVLIIKEYEFLK
ncbi:hypothetical protein JW968_02570 [Candidatus Woesearchaeota archaeon]|nr:hypothetical protein [Candidatus Woesearchaeota archaeon]